MNYLVLIFVGILFISCNANRETIVKSEETESPFTKVNLTHRGYPKHIIPYESWVRIKPEVKGWDLQYGKYSVGSNSFSIGIFDKNDNSIFGDVGEDIIFVGSVNDTTFAYTPATSSKAAIIKSNVLLQTDKNVSFSIHVNGDKSLEIKRLNTFDKTSSDLTFYTQIPEIPLVDTMNGESSDFRDLLGTKPIKIVFWASWCEPCIAELDRIYNQNIYKEKLIIALNIEEDTNDARYFLSDKNYPWLFFNSTNELNKIFDQNGIPYEVNCDSDGTILK